MLQNNTITKYRHESISIVCAWAIARKPQSLRFNYSPKINNRFRTKQNDSGYLEIANVTTNFSNQIFFYKDRIELADTGSITCFERSLHLKVLNTSRPTRKIPTNNMDGKKIFQNWIGNDNHQITLDCSVTGIPTPSILWFKNDIPINRDEIEPDGYTLKLLRHKKRDSNNAAKEYTNTVNPNITGKYHCVASNIAGNTTMVKHILPDCNIISCLWGESMGRKLMIGVSATFTVLTILLFSVLYLCRRQKLAKEEISAREIACFLHGNPEEYNESLPVEEQVCLLPYDADIEFPKQRLSLGQQIGSGAFGKVVSMFYLGRILGRRK